MRNVYLDLDTLFDTRLGVLSLINPEAAKRILTSNQYWDREHTNWKVLTEGVVTNEEFEAAWLTRDINALQSSIVTGIIPVLLNILNEYTQLKKEGLNQEDVGLIINIYPYELEPEELDELVRIIKYEVFYEFLPVTFTSISLEELTPEYMDKTFSAMILFEFHRWIKIHAAAISTANCKGLSIIVPKIFEHDPSKLPVERKKEEIMSFKMWLMDHLSLEFIDARWFSLMRPDVNEPV